MNDKENVVSKPNIELDFNTQNKTESWELMRKKNDENRQKTRKLRQDKNTKKLLNFKFWWIMWYFFIVCLVS